MSMAISWLSDPGFYPYSTAHFPHRWGQDGTPVLIGRFEMKGVRGGIKGI